VCGECGATGKVVQPPKPAVGKSPDPMEDLLGGRVRVMSVQKSGVYYYASVRTPSPLQAGALYVFQ